jgi:hypothetical protein
MTDEVVKEQTEPVVSPDASSAAPESQEESKEPKVYDENFVQKLLKEKANFKKAKEDAEAIAKSMKEQQLKEQNDFKGLYEGAKSELDAAKLTLSEIKQGEVQRTKKKALSKELKSLGLPDDYLETVIETAKLDDIKIDADTATIYGAEVVAKKLEEKFGPLFGTDSPKAAHGAPKGDTSTGKLTLEQWKQLPLDQRKARQHEVYSSLNVKFKK